MPALPDRDLTHELVERVRAASAAGTPLRIVGGDTRRSYGRPVTGTALEINGHSGVLTYDPAELVLTARGGTRLADIEALLRANAQCLPFEPPRCGDASTIGGTVAAGLAGPARSARGPVRDYVLGVRILTGDGRVLRFGGEVMKNVAGYDVSRLLAGSLGILGVILDVSLKVLPSRPSVTVRLACSAPHALDKIAGETLSATPITATSWWQDQLCVRLEGSTYALREILAMLGGEIIAGDIADAYWHDVRDQRHEFFSTDADVWRINGPTLAPVDATSSAALFMEWNGSQRWHVGADRDAVHALAHAAGGFATLFRPALSAGPCSTEVFAPLAAPVMALHRSLKRAFDPAGILNPGRMYAGL